MGLHEVMQKETGKVHDKQFPGPTGTEDAGVGAIQCGGVTVEAPHRACTLDAS